jgi:hypothetical protein
MSFLKRAMIDLPEPPFARHLGSVFHQGLGTLCTSFLGGIEPPEGLFGHQKAWFDGASSQIETIGQRSFKKIISFLDHGPCLSE